MGGMMGWKRGGARWKSWEEWKGKAGLVGIFSSFTVKLIDFRG